MNTVKHFFDQIVQFITVHFALLLTVAVMVCLVFYIIDGFTYRKQRKALLKAFKTNTETDAQRAAYRDRLQQVPTLPAEALNDGQPRLALMRWFNAWRYRKPIARHRLKLAIGQKLDHKSPLNRGEWLWLKEPVYPMERFIEFFSGIFWVLFIVWFFRSFLYEPFRIPSGSMEPTLYAGDFILTNKHSYGVKFPVWHKTIIPLGKPQRGDVIVFRYPPNEQLNYIKRIIGMPGDKIRYQDGKVWINDQLQKWLPPVTVEGYKAQLTEDLAGHPHPIQMYPERRVPWQNTLIVPKGRYFVMGDNRDDSEDSRVWGFVPEENIVGKASLIWMNSNCIFGKGDCDHIGRQID